MALVLVDESLLSELTKKAWGQTEVRLVNPIYVPGIGEVWERARFERTAYAPDADACCGDGTANSCVCADTSSAAATSTDAAPADNAASADDECQCDECRFDATFAEGVCVDCA